jgi:uncharacterized protein (DUF849 family)
MLINIALWIILALMIAIVPIGCIMTRQRHPKTPAAPQSLAPE